jgi:hypothetical protein
VCCRVSAKAAECKEHDAQVVIFRRQQDTVTGSHTFWGKRPCSMLNPGREIVGPRYTTRPNMAEGRSHAKCWTEETRRENSDGRQGIASPVSLMGKRHLELGEGSRRMLEGAELKKVAPGTKLAPRWCPAGLTKM